MAYIDIIKFNKLVNDMGIHAQADYPAEVCGLITTDYIYVPCKNISSSKNDSFILDPLALLEYEDNTWAIYHSHPGQTHPLPSEEDLAHTCFNEYKFLVGFADKYFIYWYNTKKKILMYEPFGIEHCEQ